MENQLTDKEKELLEKILTRSINSNEYLIKIYKDKKSLPANISKKEWAEAYINKLEFEQLDLKSIKLKLSKLQSTEIKEWN